jgi:hypothetical protein
MNQLIHTSPTLVLHQLGWGIPHTMRCNHAYAFYLDSITNSNGNTKFSLAWTLTVVTGQYCPLQNSPLWNLYTGHCVSPTAGIILGTPV